MNVFPQDFKGLAFDQAQLATVYFCHQLRRIFDLRREFHEVAEGSIKIRRALLRRVCNGHVAHTREQQPLSAIRPGGDAQVGEFWSNGRGAHNGGLLMDTGKSLG